MTIDDARDPMAAWAAARGLTFEEEGLLPPVTDALRAGTGAGEHRAGFILEDSGGRFTAVGGFRKWPERSTWNLCSGRLPGGVDGVVAHHVHLVLRSGGSDGQSWYASPATVVFAVLPDGVRACRWLTGRPGTGGGVSALGTVSVGAADPIVPVPTWRAEISDTTWTATPAEDPARLERIARAAADVLPFAPERTRVELRDGALVVVAPGVVHVAEQLDALCAVATAVAGAVAAIAADEPVLDPATPVGPPPDDPRQAWLAEGVTRVTWPSPPPSVDAAQAAYRHVAERGARARGVRWKTRLIALAAVLVFIVLWSGIDALAIALFPGIKGELLILFVVTLVFLVPPGLRAAWKAGSEVHADDVTARALPWGLEAFSREYAAARGLRLEDPARFRHRFRSPIPGIPLRVMHGDLGGAPGWVALWADDTMPQRRNLLLAVVAAPEGGAPSAAGYGTHVRDGLLVLAEEVPAAERSAARLDALRAAAVAAAGA